ncbi:dienelactone hydrolase family protein [bacterium]|nr:dienelactone hydrolase family protein [bacterium]MBP9810817.1 dienelactone hydrolase family protein [bacterium]
MADVNERPKASETATAAIDSGAWTKGANSKGPVGLENTSKTLPAGFSNDFEIADASSQSASTKEAPASSQATAISKFDAVAAAKDLNDALNPAFFSMRLGPNGDRVFNKLLNMTPDQFKAVDKEFTKSFGESAKPWFSGGGAWSLEDNIKANLSSSDSDRLSKLIESKKHNDVPAEHRVTGEQLLKPGSNLKVGEINPVTLSDGRRYDVYVPQNADNRAPVIVAMHGAAAGDSIGLMAQESGLTADAERTGAIVVFAYPKPREFDAGVGNVTGVAWNVPDRTNLPKAVDKDTDDRKYLDSVIDDLKTKSQTAEKVGLFGFSDGGRFAQIYAADRPDRVAAVVSHNGTWMNGEQAPTNGKPVMIVHGDADKTLPYEGGMGSVSKKMDWLLGTNLEQSAPHMQAKIWKEADHCQGPVEEVKRGDITERTYTGCTVGEVKEYIVKGGEHALNDYKNDGVRFAQWLLGSADRRQAFSTEGAKFLTRHIVSDLSMKRPK